MTYKVVFDYTGERWIINMMRSALEQEYVKIYQQFCDITNGGVIDKLNKEFSEKYPDYKIADDLWSSVEYIEHFRKGYDEVVKEIMLLNPGLMKYDIGDELNLIGKLTRFGKEITITFHIEES